MNSDCELLSTIPDLHRDADTVIARLHDDDGTIRISMEDLHTLIALKSPGSLRRLAVALRRHDLVSAIDRFSRQSKLGTFIPPGLLKSLKESIESGELDRQRLPREEMRLKRLCDLGLLVRKEQFFSSLPEGCPALSRDSIDVTAVPTCDRPTQLSRLLRALSVSHDDKASCGVNPRMLIVDDSRETSSRTLTRAIIDSQITDNNHACSYIGMRERQQMITDLASISGHPRTILEFALMPNSQLMTDGATRNVIALCSQGQLMLSFDDDVAGVVLTSSSHHKGLSISTRRFPYEINIGSGIWDLADSFQHVARPEHAHRGILGASVADLCCTSRSIKEWPAISQPNMTAGDVLSGRIGVTTMGSFGDSGMDSMGGVLLSASELSLAKICRDANTYNSAMASRAIHRYVQELTLTRTAYLQAMCLGLDCRQLVPPFFPMGRNTDGLFINLLLGLDRKCWIAHLPETLVHLVDPHRTDNIPYRNHGSRLRLSDLLRLCIEDCMPPVPSSLTSGLTTLGASLEQISRLGRRSAQSYLGKLVITNQHRLLHYIDARRSEFVNVGAPFVKDLEEIALSIRRAIDCDPIQVPVDLEKHIGARLSHEYMMRVIGVYGTLLKLWPELWECSKSVQFLDRFALTKRSAAL